MTALYIHIPFCVKKCGYCDFISFPAVDEEIINRYITALCEEIVIRKEVLSDGISTLYFGGGTPSILSPSHFEQIFSAIKNTCPDFPRQQEITAETNPCTVDIEKLKSFKALGINRISLGMQSFNNRLLSLLGRIHTAEEAIKVFKASRDAGFENISIDLMSALPSQSLEEWKLDIQKAVLLAPEHISVYNLQVEEGTPMWKKKYQPVGEAKELIFPDEETDAEMYIFASEYLRKHNYLHYEISNFALPGRESRHNLTYWKNLDYLGLGVAAHSSIDGKRFANTKSLEEYITCPSEAVIEIVPATELSHKQEIIFLGLRMIEGIAKTCFEGFEEEVKQFIDEGLLEEHRERYRLTEQGILLANTVFSHFV